MADEINNGLSPEVELELDGIDVNPTLDVSVDGLDVNPTLEMELQVEMGSRSSERNAEAWAVGERGGVPVSSTDQTYHNNSKYYAQQAGESAEAAETAASGAAAAVDKYPKIENGTWWVWDPVGAEWVDTEVPARGPQGNPGQGVPTGGTTGQILQKKSGTDYDMEWGSAADPSVKADKVTGATSGNFAGLDASGNLTDSGKKPSDFLTQHQDITGKADKVSGATSGNFAGLDGNGNLTDSGKKPGDFITQHQDISGKADKVSGATSGNFAGLDGNGNLTDSGKKPGDFITQHQDITGKADKVSGATSGNFAGLDANGNLTDSGKKPGDFITQHQDITGKADKVSGATSGNFAGLDSAGNLTDSGIGPDGIFYVQSGSSSAAQAYKKGDYILVAGSLSKALTDIASGASFTPANLAPAAAALCVVAERAEDTAGGIGWVEDTNSATHAISKGDYVLWKGSLCKASAAIAIGDTLSSSNLTAVSGGLGAEVASLSAHLENLETKTAWTRIKRSGDDSYIDYCKMGNLVWVNLYHKVSTASISAWTGLNMGTLPSGYRPCEYLNVPCVTDRAASIGTVLQIEKSGIIWVLARYNAVNDSNDLIRASTVFFV